MKLFFLLQTSNPLDRIQCVFLEFDLESYFNCVHDWVVISEIHINDEGMFYLKAVPGKKPIRVKFCMVSIKMKYLSVCLAIGSQGPSCMSTMLII